MDCQRIQKKDPIIFKCCRLAMSHNVTGSQVHVKGIRRTRRQLGSSLCLFQWIQKRFPAIHCFNARIPFQTLAKYKPFFAILTMVSLHRPVSETNKKSIIFSFAHRNYTHHSDLFKQIAWNRPKMTNVMKEPKISFYYRRLWIGRDLHLDKPEVPRHKWS